MLSDAGAVDCGLENLAWYLFFGITPGPEGGLAGLDEGLTAGRDRSPGPIETEMRSYEIRIRCASEPSVRFAF